MTDPADLTPLEQLLPFYVNGTLDAEGRARIEAALPGSPALQRALAGEQALHERLIAATERELAASEAGQAARQAALGARLEEPARAAVAGPARSGRLAQALSALNPRQWNPAVSLGLALALGAAWVAGDKLGLPGGHSYQTASGCDDGPASKAPLLVIRLKDDARWADVEALLSQEQLSIVSGPDEGRLTVRADDPAAKPAELRARLEGSPLVAFAGEIK